MMNLRIYKLTEEAEKRGIDWSNFEDTDIETVEEIEVEDDAADADKIAYEHGYGDTDIYGYEWM